MKIPELHAEVSRLLRASKDAEAGAHLAKENSDLPAAQRLVDKSEDLEEQAAILDPKFTAPAWKE